MTYTIQDFRRRESWKGKTRSFGDWRCGQIEGYNRTRQATEGARLSPPPSQVGELSHHWKQTHQRPRSMTPSRQEYMLLGPDNVRSSTLVSVAAAKAST